MDAKTRRYARIRRGIKRRLDGIPTATLLDCSYIAVSILIVLGLLRGSSYLFLRVGSYVSQAMTVRVEANQPTSPLTPAPAPDPRVQKLQTYLALKGSPLADYAQLIVEEADRWDIGWTKLAAIAGKESGYGLRIPPGSHNAWGVGGGRFIFFASWEEGIRYTSKLLGEKYQWNENRGIQTKYCPDSDGCAKDWAMTVTQFSHEILATERR